MIPEMRRPLPSLDRWLTDNGDGTRGDGFEAFNDLAQRTLARDLVGLSADELSFLRMLQGFSIAIVEVSNIEHQRGRSPDQIVQMMPRALAAAAFYATASVLKEDSPWRAVAKVLIEEFRFGAKEAADQHVARLERDAT